MQIWYIIVLRKNEKFLNKLELFYISLLGQNAFIGDFQTMLFTIWKVQ